MSTRTQNMARTLLVLAALVPQSTSACPAEAALRRRGMIAQTVNVDFDREANFARCTTDEKNEKKLSAIMKMMLKDFPPGSNPKIQ